MTQTTDFVIGTGVSCTDGPCGKVTRVVIDPVRETVTDLVVEPEHRSGLGRLVPLALVTSQDGGIRLSCTQADFERLDSAEETEYIPGSSGYAEYGPDQVLVSPYYGLAGGLGGGAGISEMSQTITYDAVPDGDVAVHRGDHVHATDGTIGRVQGLVVEPSSHHVTHVLLQEGHLWGRKEVAIPITAVTRTDDGIHLSITKDQVRDLPPVDIDHRHG
jgi:sporulation protein YlmC with PRC-barrel domain